MEFDAAVIDLDGTLLDSSKSVSERSVNAIRRCHQAGMNIIIATARPPRAVKRFLPEELK